MGKQQANPYYAEAVELFEQAARSLAALAQQDPSEDWPQHALLEAYCCLAVCHWKTGRTALAEQTFQEHVRPLVAGISEHRADQPDGPGRHGARSGERLGRWWTTGPPLL